MAISIWERQLQHDLQIHKLHADTLQATIRELSHILGRCEMKKSNDGKIQVLDLFSGIGGFSLGLERTGRFKTVAFCEIEAFPRLVLKKHWPNIPIASDIYKLSYEDGVLYDAGKPIYRGQIDVVCGGFPCQPFSVAGQKKGQEDDRDLWPSMFHIIQQIKPSWVIGENVANFVKMAFTRTKLNLESEGYTVQPFIIPACAVGAPHRRDRVWIVAHANGKRCRAGRHNREAGQVSPHQYGNAEKSQSPRTFKQCGVNQASTLVTDDGCKRIQGRKPKSFFGQPAFSWCEDVRGLEDYFNRPDIPQPLICRDGDGFSSRVDRLRALGNAVVPQIPEMIGQAIIAQM